MGWPKLPAKAAYLVLDNPQQRNALSLGVLKSLKEQLIKYNSSKDGKQLFLPTFKPSLLDKLGRSPHKPSYATYHKQHGWLVDPHMWSTAREGLPNVLVLRSEGPVFSSGHDLKEISSMTRGEVSEVFALCAEVMSLIRRSPAIVVGVVQGLATAAGAQLALATDLPIACASTQFQLPGASIGLPCTSPSTVLSRRLGNAFTYRMLALAEPVRADQLPGGVVETVADEEVALEKRVSEVVEKLACRTAGQPQALGKWAYWTQVGMQGGDQGGDGYEDAAKWAARAMALHAKCADAEEGIRSFIEKREPEWKS
ncbi:hypothetical protein DL765_009196 [Monosporascus sp. GIB2]|nr:hypothetical protein DL765_009196 [Monosporascus sp. GIB2]